MSMNSSLENNQAFAKLRQQEKQVLFRMTQGRSNQEIAKGLFLGEGTIQHYIHSILSKLGLDDQKEAIEYALKYDLKGHLGM